MPERSHRRGRKERPLRTCTEARPKSTPKSPVALDVAQEEWWKSFYGRWHEYLWSIAAQRGVPRNRRVELIQKALLKLLARWEEFCQLGGERDGFFLLI